LLEPLEKEPHGCNASADTGNFQLRTGWGTTISAGKLTTLERHMANVPLEKRVRDPKRELQTLRRMVMVGNRERRLVTFELHDGVAQQLVGAMMHFQSLEPRKGRTSEERATAHRDGMAALREASSELRRVMNWLRTPVLDRFGLAEAIQDLAAQRKLIPGAPEIDYRHEVKFKRLEPTLENSLFRIAQESLTNACRHSQSEKVRVRLTQKGDTVTLEVRDWGIGFDQGTVQENRFGLEGIRERSRLLGGRLSIKSKPGHGTVVRVTFPVTEAFDQE
jgi:signal transduction histidine kinase